jgi:hypothetical protein
LQVRHRKNTMPTQITTSPALKTLVPGIQDGVANTSPSQGSFGSASTPELVKSPVSVALPAARSADSEAGSVPPFSEMVSPLSPPPKPISRMPGRYRLAITQAAARTYEATCATASAVASASGTTEITRIWSASATHSSQTCRIRIAASRDSGARSTASTSSVPTQR